jgi:hypothetical protein
MKYININGILTKAEDTQSAGCIKDGIFLSESSANCVIEKDSAEYILWGKFGKPSGLKGYLENAMTISYEDMASSYQLNDNGAPVFYDENTNELTTVDTGYPAIVDANCNHSLESNVHSNGSCVLKAISKLVSCGGVNAQSIIDTGLAYLEDKERKKDNILALLNNFSEDQMLTAVNAIKDSDLTGSNFDIIYNAIIGG